VHSESIATIRGAVRHSVPLTCAVLDVDNFERVNERLGYEAGDAILKEIAGVIQGYSRQSDCLRRLSGDSFLLLLTECSEQDAARCVDRIREVVAGTSITCKEIELRSTISIGVAQRQHDTSSFDMLVTMAEQALQIAKETGRDRVTKYRSLHEPSGANSLIAGNSLSDIVARDVMTTPITCLRSSATALEAARFSLNSQLTSIPVVDDDGLLVGILSEKDLLSDMSNPVTASTPIHNLMTTDVVCFHEEEKAHSICAFLSNAAIRRVVIVKNHRPVGIISRGSLLRHFCRADEGPVGETSNDANKHGAESDDELASRIATQVGMLASDVRDVAAEHATPFLSPIE
jgi:diguanylate cyclase (GGDEF)-like protein